MRHTSVSAQRDRKLTKSNDKSAGRERRSKNQRRVQKKPDQDGNQAGIPTLAQEDDYSQSPEYPGNNGRVPQT